MRSIYYRISFFSVFVFLSQISYSQGNKKIPSEKPKLIVGIIIDQMRYDYLFRYWDKFESRGFKRLINEGTFCKNANYNYLFTQSGPGHATIFSGTTPSHHGIISDHWFLRLKEKTVGCAEDEKENTVGGSYEAGRMSPRNLLSTTLGDEMRLSNNFNSKVYGIAMEGNASILSSGHTANTAYWFDGESGNWVTSSFYRDSLPGWVKEFNNKKFPDIYLEREWTTLMPIELYTESLPDYNYYEIGFGNQITFPYNLYEISKVKKKKKSYEILKSTPFGNTFTKDFVIATIVNENLGQDEYTDLLTVSFSATNYIGQLFGPTSIEVEDTYLRLDRDIAHFLDFINENIGKENVLIFLTANHGVAHIPKYLIDLKIPAGYFNQNSSVSLLKSYLNIIYGSGDWIQFYYAQQLYLNHNLIEDSKLSLEEMQTRVAHFFLQYKGVANTVTAHTLQTTNFTNGILEMVQNSYNQKRSGDIIINFDPGWIEKSKNSTAHNSAYTYDTHVPLIWYGWKINRRTISKPIGIIDIAPTISTFLNISFPNACSGKPILELVE